MEKDIIFNIQRYSLHDGGGVRTVVFFKGCRLRCPWCSNPESQNFSAEIMRKESLCTKCSSSSVYKCTVNTDDCPTGALEEVGKEYTVEEVMEEVKKDIVFYETTGMVNFEIINEVAEYVDTFLWDFKIMDKYKSTEIINADIELIKSNFENLIKSLRL